LGGGGHFLGERVVEGGGLLAEDVFAGAEGGEGLGVMQRDGCGEVDGVNLGVGEGVVEVGVGFAVVGDGFGGVARKDGVEAGARFGENGGEDAFGCDVADAGEEPVEHAAIVSGDQV
jgi:hypothetical protein